MRSPGRLFLCRQSLPRSLCYCSPCMCDSQWRMLQLPPDYRARHNYNKAMTRTMEIKYGPHCVHQIRPTLCPSNTAHIVSIKYGPHCVHQIRPSLCPSNTAHIVSIKYGPHCVHQIRPTLCPSNTAHVVSPFFLINL